MVRRTGNQGQNPMTEIKAYQIEVTSSASNKRQVFFVEATTEDEAMSVLARSGVLLPEPVLKLQRRLSDSEIDMHQIGRGSVVQWI